MLRIAWLELFNACRVQLLLALNLIFCAMPLFAQTSLNLGSPRSASSGGNAAPRACAIEQGQLVSDSGEVRA